MWLLQYCSKIIFISWVCLTFIAYEVFNQSFITESCPWWCNSWIYNYVCNQCLSPFVLWVRILIREVYNSMWSSLAVTCDRSVVFSESSDFLHKWNWPSWYSWNIVERGVKHYQSSKKTYNIACFWREL